jgi:hypothetical protein
MRRGQLYTNGLSVWSRVCSCNALAVCLEKKHREQGLWAVVGKGGDKVAICLGISLTADSERIHGVEFR